MASIPIIPQPTGNPILDNPALKAQLTAQMQQSAQPQGAQMPPALAGTQAPMIHPQAQESAPPPAATMPGNDRLSLPSSAAPSVTAPRGTSAGDEAELSRKLKTGSGISQIAGKIENSGLGQAHPVLGKILGIGAQGLAQLGDIGLRTIAPSVDIATPGTSLHHLADIRGDQKQVAQDTANEEREAQTGATQAEIPLRQAEATKAQAEAAALPGEQAQKQKLEDAQIANLMHPQAKTAFEAWRQQNPDAPVTDFLQAQQDVKPQKEPGGPKTIQKEVSGRPHTFAYDETTKDYTKDEGETGEKPPVVNVNAGTAALDRESARYAKTHEKNVNDANAQLEKIADARAMVNGSAEAQALGIPKVLTALVSGQGSGVRITQPELNAIGQARGIKGDMQGWLNSISGKGKLTTEQKTQLTQILDDVQARILQKQGISNEALDRIDRAGSREDIIQADQDARHKLGDLEKGGTQSSGKGVSLKQAMSLPVNKGKSEADVRKDIEAHGHQVIQ